MSLSNDTLVERVKADPNFQELVRKRSVFAWTLSVNHARNLFRLRADHRLQQELFAKSLSGGVTTVGIPVGLGVIVSAFVLTGIYVVRANTAFDELTKKIVEKAKG